MSLRPMLLRATLALGVSAPLAGAAGDTTVPEAGNAETVPSRESLDLFESRVRPVLVESCFGCHGEEKQRGGLRVDSRAAVLEGSDTGPVVVPGEPERSPLLAAIRHSGEIKMPPSGKLAEPTIDAIAEWIRRGAPWPAEAGTAPGAGVAGRAARLSAPTAAEARTRHWAFRPIADPPVPPVREESWCATPIDRFVLAKLEENGLAPRAPADPRTLLRRATYVLTGLPPTADEVESFAADPTPAAWESAVDRLLASPRHGERWARHWLDVARYADTKGYVFEEERRFPYSYTYRDWVIGAINDDIPYDRFLVEQVAADLLRRDGDDRSLAAMGFLTLGRRFLNNRHDIIDDRIDVVTRGTMALTVACARCHDHKYDPIPTADYYSLYGVFASAVEPEEPPVIETPEPTEAYLSFEKELRAREAAVAAFVEERRSAIVAGIRERAADYLLAASAPPSAGDPEPGSLPAGALNPVAVRRWRALLERAKEARDPVFGPWLRFAAIPPGEFAAAAAEVAGSLAAPPEGDTPANPAVAKALVDPAPASLEEAARRYGAVLAAATGGPDSSDPAHEEIRAALRGEGSPLEYPGRAIERLFDREAGNRLRDLRRQVDAWRVAGAGGPKRAMSLVEGPRPHDPMVFVRGNPGNPGPPVPRRFLEVLAGDRQPFREGSGRLELARAIASPGNPLTARVLVNRVWMHHFGSPLVGTPGDFGLRSEAPSHPELLDWLATRFIEDGWSLKRLHRRILFSSAWRQSSEDDPDASRIDPENRLLWRQNRRRLDLEALRDSLLATCGRLDLAVGGPAVDIAGPEPSFRRTIYGFIDRQNLPGLFRTFDFASPDTTSPRRHSTTVPQQALFLMNSPFAVEQARALAARPEVAGAPDSAARVRALYRTVFARPPDEDEAALGAGYLDSAARESAELTPVERYCQALLLSNEFAFLD